MVTVLETQEQIEQIDLQILHLLEDRVKLYQSMNLTEDEGEVLAETISMWLEEAGEKGFDEDLIERLVKVITLLGKKVEE